MHEHNIRVKVIEPGHFKSDFLTRGLEWANHSAYERPLSNLKGWIGKYIQRAKEPSVVAEAIFDAVNDPTDRLRYGVGAGLLTMRAILPDALWRRMMSISINRAPRRMQGAPEASR